MKKVIEFATAEGAIILAEVDMPDVTGGMERVSRAGDVLAKANQTLEEALDRIKPLSTAVINTLRNADYPSDKIEVEFGIKLSAESGVILASSTIEANFKVKLTWNRSHTAQ